MLTVAWGSADVDFLSRFGDTPLRIRVSCSEFATQVVQHHRFAFFANAIAAVVDNRVLHEIANRCQLHTSRSVYAEVDSTGLPGSLHFSLSDRKLVGNQVANLAKTGLNVLTERLDVDCTSCEANHKFAGWSGEATKHSGR